MIHRHKKTVTCEEVKTGSLLISTPVNLKLRNSRVLTLITQVDEFGTTGIMLNQQLPGEKQVKRIYGSSDPVEVQLGGPDNLNSESYLITYPSFKNGWFDSLFWSHENLDIMTVLHYMSEYNLQINAFKGCVYWAPGELESEISNKLWWFTNEYQIHNLVNTGTHSWKQYAKSYGGFYSELIDDDNMMLSLN